MQFAIKDYVIHVLEVNPRASRTVALCPKTVGSPIAKVGAQHHDLRKPGGRFALMARCPNHPHADPYRGERGRFPFAKFPGVDTLLGPEMRSTGEVMGLDRDYALAFAKAQLGARVDLPRSGTVFVSVRERGQAARA